MMMMMKISIVIPAYNAERYIEAAVKSASITSDLINIELVIVNDGSKDNTLAVCNQLAYKYKNVVVIDQQNAGAMAARANGVLRATGDYVMFCDADDTIETNNLVHFAEVAYANDYDIVVGCSHDYSSDGKVDFIQYNKISGEISAVGFVEDILRSKIIFGPACKLFHRRLISQECFNLPNDIVFNEDLFMNIALAKTADKIIVLRDLIVYNHLTDNPDSVTHTKKQSEEQWLRLFKVIRQEVSTIAGFDINSFVTFVCDRLRTNYFNHGTTFRLNREVLALIDKVDKSRISTREKATIMMLRYPILSRYYNFFFSIRRKLS